MPLGPVLETERQVDILGLKAWTTMPGFIYIFKCQTFLFMCISALCVLFKDQFRFISTNTAWDWWNYQNLLQYLMVFRICLSAVLGIRAGIGSSKCSTTEIYIPSPVCPQYIAKLASNLPSSGLTSWAQQLLACITTPDLIFVFI